MLPSRRCTPYETRLPLNSIGDSADKMAHIERRQ